MISSEQLQAALGIKKVRADKWLKPLNDAMHFYDISTPKRMAAFLAQIAHESMKLYYVREIWGPTKAQLTYEKRKDLGNTAPGDGKKFMGRGLIQITGRANYAKLAGAMGLNLLEQPELLEQPQNAAHSAAWFWNQHGFNALADQGHFETITKRINGGLNGYENRCALWKQCKTVLGVE